MEFKNRQDSLGGTIISIGAPGAVDRKIPPMSVIVNRTLSGRQRCFELFYYNGDGLDIKEIVTEVEESRFLITDRSLEVAIAETGYKNIFSILYTYTNNEEGLFDALFSSLAWLDRPKEKPLTFRSDSGVESILENAKTVFNKLTSRPRNINSVTFENRRPFAISVLCREFSESLVSQRLIDRFEEENLKVNLLIEADPSLVNFDMGGEISTCNSVLHGLTELRDGLGFSYIKDIFHLERRRIDTILPLSMFLKVLGIKVFRQVNNNLVTGTKLYTCRHNNMEELEAADFFGHSPYDINPYSLEPVYAIFMSSMLPILVSGDKVKHDIDHFGMYLDRVREEEKKWRAHLLDFEHFIDEDNLECSTGIERALLAAKIESIVAKKFYDASQSTLEEKIMSFDEFAALLKDREEVEKYRNAVAIAISQGENFRVLPRHMLKNIKSDEFLNIVRNLQSI